MPDRKAAAIKTPYVCSANGPMRNRIGYMVYEKTGVLEYWSTGVLEKIVDFEGILASSFSITPSLHYSSVLHLLEYQIKAKYPDSHRYSTVGHVECRPVQAPDMEIQEVDNFPKTDPVYKIA
jgi:hypothetical protein